MDPLKSRMSFWRETSAAGILRDVWSFVLFAERRYLDDRMGQAAAALTFNTLLAIVPLLVIALAVLAGFPAFDAFKQNMQDALLGTMLPEVGADISEYLANFTRSATELTTFGILGLAVTAVLLLSNIEQMLNRIWKVERQRPFLHRLLIFWAILTVGPVLLGASFSLTSDSLTSLREWSSGQSDIATIGLNSNAAKKVVSFATETIAFTLLYMLVPARPVRLRDAAIGGVFVGLGFLVLHWIFNTFLTSGSTYATIYGAVAVIPIFLLWIHLSWTVIILGALLAASFPDWWRRRDTLSGQALTPAEGLGIAVAVLGVLARQSAKGGTIDPLALAETVPLLSRDKVMEQLLQSGYIVESTDDRLSLARDLHVTSVADLARDMGLALGLQPSDANRPTLASVLEAAGELPALLTRLAKSEDEILSMPLAEVVMKYNPTADMVPAQPLKIRT